MRPSSIDRLSAWSGGELACAAIATLPLTAWASLAWVLDAVGASMPEAAGPVVSALASTLMCAGIVTLGRRRRALAQPMMLALTSSVVALPWVHQATLSWLSAPQVGDFGDAVWRLIPTHLYGITWNPFAAWGATLVVGVVGVVSLLAAHVLLAMLGRGRRVAVFTAIATALLAASVGAMGVCHATRPSLAQWLDGFSVVRRMPVRDVEEGRPWTERGTVLAEGVRAWRDGVDARGRVTLQVIAPTMVSSGDVWTPDAEDLDCDVEATLALRRGPGPRMLLSCEQPRWNTHVCRAHEDPVTVVEVHSWEARVCALDVLLRTAPPPAWTVVAALGLLAALAMLRGDRTVVRGALAALHPYRAAAPSGDDTRDEFARALTAVGAVAVATHAASPWLLVWWTHLADLLHGR